MPLGLETRVWRHYRTNFQCVLHRKPLPEEHLEAELEELLEPARLDQQSCFARSNYSKNSCSEYQTENHAGGGAGVRDDQPAGLGLQICQLRSVYSGRKALLTVDILAQGEESFLAPCEFCKSIVCRVGLDLQSHMSPVAVELPD